MRRHLAATSLCVLAACASTDAPRTRDLPTPNPHEKLGARYEIKGRWYEPRHQPDYDARGIASWYGPKFHGRLTANGELFDMDRLTAAHKTLPLPSLVRVENLENGRSAVLRVNDRGPFAGDRIIDLSRAAAEKLGTRRAGLGRVRVQYLGPAPMEEAIVSLGAPETHADGRRAMPVRRVRGVPATTVATRAALDGEPLPDALEVAGIAIVVADAEDEAPVREQTPQAWYVRVGAFADAGNAARAAGRLPEAVPIALTTDADGLNRLRIGPYADEFPAREALRVARAAGFADAGLVRGE